MVSWMNGSVGEMCDKGEHGGVYEEGRAVIAGPDGWLAKEMVAKATG